MPPTARRESTTGRNQQMGFRPTDDDLEILASIQARLGTSASGAIRAAIRFYDQSFPAPQPITANGLADNPEKKAKKTAKADGGERRRKGGK